MPISETNAMIAGMTPKLQPGRWVYCHSADATEVSPDAFALIREKEGATLILPYDAAKSAGHDVRVVMALITLDIYSDLEGVGLTAAVASTLAKNDISCNVVAAYHHDHIFVAEGDADRALMALTALQQTAQTDAKNRPQT